MANELRAKSSRARQALGALATSAVILVAVPGATYAQVAPHSNGHRINQELAVLPEKRIKELYLHCSREASRHAMGFGEAALCSMIYETLLGRVFGGDFHALLAWSAVQPDEVASAAPTPAVPAKTADGMAR